MIITDDTGAVLGAYYADGTTVVADIVTEVQNPITRSVCRLDPPLPLADLDAFQSAFGALCDAAWMLPTRRDPQRVDPRRVIDGTEPVDVLDDTVARMVAEHGPWAVSAAVAKLMPEH